MKLTENNLSSDILESLAAEGISGNTLKTLLFSLQAMGYDIMNNHFFHELSRTMFDLIRTGEITRLKNDTGKAIYVLTQYLKGDQ